MHSAGAWRVRSWCCQRQGLGNHGVRRRRQASNGRTGARASGRACLCRNLGPSRPRNCAPSLAWPERWHFDLGQRKQVLKTGFAGDFLQDEPGHLIESCPRREPREQRIALAGAVLLEPFEPRDEAVRRRMGSISSSARSSLEAFRRKRSPRLRRAPPAPLGRAQLPQGDRDRTASHCILRVPFGIRQSAGPRRRRPIFVQSLSMSAAPQSISMVTPTTAMRSARS